LGLLGSSGLKRYWDKQKYPYQDAMIITLDVISRGRKPLVVYHYNDSVARRILPYLQKSRPETEKIDMGIVPLSDNYVFKSIGAVTISCVDPSIIPGGYTVPRIHTPQDNDFFPVRVCSLLTGISDFLLDDITKQDI
jgi:hypothetical protein